MSRRRRPSSGGANYDRDDDARGWAEFQRCRITRILRRVIEDCFLSDSQVAQIATKGSCVRLSFRVLKLRNRDRRQNADDHDDDQQLDEGEGGTHACLHGSLGLAVGEQREVTKVWHDDVRKASTVPFS